METVNRITPFCANPIKPHSIFDAALKKDFFDRFNQHLSFNKKLYPEKEAIEKTIELMDNYICYKCVKKIDNVMRISTEAKLPPPKRQSLKERLKATLRRISRR